MPVALTRFLRKLLPRTFPLHVSLIHDQSLIYALFVRRLPFPKIGVAQCLNRCVPVEFRLLFDCQGLGDPEEYFPQFFRY